MASSSTHLCWAVGLCAVPFASGFLVAYLASLRPSKKSAVQKKETPSSIITPTKKYNVFLSFRGEDTRVGFTSHLHDALSRKFTVTFIDYELARGDEISPALLKSIQESMIAVVIFSKDYASSKWCLRELVEITKRKKLNELTVLPIFYYVHPSDVRKQIGPFKDSFAKHKNESQDEVQEWRKAFTEASNLAGWDYAGTRSESELVGDIVEDVQRILMSKDISSSSDFEGKIDKRIAPVTSLLCLDTMDVRIIGILGMAGIAKTFLAEAVFSRISGQFDGVCFMRNVTERIEKHGALDTLEREVLSKVLDEENLKLATTAILHPFIRERLSRRKVLIVLDDVSTFLQLETLVEVLKRSGLGSRMIITSRDKQVLINFVDDPEHIYEFDRLQGIDDSEIFDILKFSYDGLSDEEKDLFLDIVCFFNGYFKDTIEKLLDCKVPLITLVDKSLITIKDGGIEMHDLLQEMGTAIVRRESLKNPGKRSRLWKADDVIWTLKNNKGTKAVEGIYLNMDKLKDRHLNLSCRVFDKMTNLRVLLFTCDLKSVNDLESNIVHLSDGRLNSLPDELIILEWPTYPLRALPSNFSPKKLVKLDLSYSNIEQLWEGTEDAPKLKWLLLGRCPRLTRIPNLSSSSSLEEVDLRDCESLVEFPLTSASIKRLCLSGTAIEEVPSSIQHLTNLVKLDLSRCTRLKHISAGCFKLESVTTLEMLPSSICDLTSLEHLDLSNCTKLDKLPEKLGNLKSLKHLIVKGSAVGQLPSSIRYLENLEFLDCSECRGLTKLPPLAGLRSLSKLFLMECNLMEIPEDIGCLSSLEWLDLCGNKFKSLPKSIKHLSKLETLSLCDCNMLGSLTELPVALQKLDAINCKQLCQALPDASEFKRFISSKCHISRWEWDEHLEELCQLCPPQYVRFFFFNCFNLDQKAVSNVFKESLEGSEEPPTQFSIYLPGTEIPEWFTYKSSGSSINIRVLRQDLVNRKFMGFAICAVLGIEEFHELPDCLAVDIYCHFETCADRSDFPPSGDSSTGRVSINSDHILLGYSSFSKFLSSSQNLEMLPGSECDHVDIQFKFDNPSEEFKVKYCAVHPIHAKPMKIIGATIEDIGETSGRRSG